MEGDMFTPSEALDFSAPTISFFGTGLWFLQAWKMTVYYGPRPLTYGYLLKGTLSLQCTFISNGWQSRREWNGSQPLARLEVEGKGVGMKSQELSIKR